MHRHAVLTPRAIIAAMHLPMATQGTLRLMIPQVTELQLPRHRVRANDRDVGIDQVRIVHRRPLRRRDPCES
jgi:hypothetical protein